jgi:hypothetical protein
MIVRLIGTSLLPALMRLDSRAARQARRPQTAVAGVPLKRASKNPAIP